MRMYKGSKMSEEQKLKISRSSKGKKMSPEAIEKTRQANIGRVVSIKTRMLLSKANKGRKKPHGFGKKISISKMGSKLSDAHKLKLSLAKRGSKHPYYGKRRPESTIQKIREARKKQKLPFRDTKGEREMQSILKKLDIEFTKQKPFKMLDNSYHQVDIFIEPNICIEVDGEYWHTIYSRQQRDILITTSLESQGLTVIRCWDTLIFTNPKPYINEILQNINQKAQECKVKC